MAKAAKNVSASPLAASAIALLSAIVAGTVTRVQQTDDSMSLVTAKLIEVNTSDVTPEGAAVRATDEGTKMTQTNTTGATGDTAPATPKPTFAFLDIDIPKGRKPREAGESLYPFGDLPPPDAATGKTRAFFVPATAERPKPWESLASTISTASARYRKETGAETYTNAKGEAKERKTYEYERKFKLTEGEHEGVKGAFVSRIK